MVEKRKEAFFLIPCSRRSIYVLLFIIVVDFFASKKLGKEKKVPNSGKNAFHMCLLFSEGSR